MIFLKQSINIFTSLTDCIYFKCQAIALISLPQVGFTISPVTPENSGQYWCLAKYRGKTSEYGISLNVLMETRWVS